MMKPIILLFTALFFLSCGKNKAVQLPEISDSGITEIQDVSAAYLFYNETQPDSVELNRKNLISTTNWLINIDKRLTLKQVIPHIKFLQEKKGNSSHKNKNAKNYFTCHDTGINNLGFVEFTDIVYTLETPKSYFNEKYKSKTQGKTVVTLYDNLKRIEIGKTSKIWKKSTFKNGLNEIIINSESKEIVLSFSKNITFQDYIWIKETIEKYKLQLKISNDELIFHSSS